MSINLQKAQSIIVQRFEYLKKVFKEEFKIDLKGSSLESCFYYPEHLDAILEWNRNAGSPDDLIDLAGYNEHTIGNFETAKIVFLGNNPGSAGVLGENQEQEMQKIRRSVQFLKRYPGLFDTFYPIVNNELMRFKPWFGNKLRRSDSILGPFLQINPDISRFAPYIASAELSPYHTRYFNDAGLDELSWEKNEEVHNKIRHCMKHGVVLIAIYAGAKDRWIRQIPELANYESFYFCHNIPRGTPHFGDEMESLHNPDQSAYGEILETVKRLFPVNIIN